jgi:hypothetical protein
MTNGQGNLGSVELGTFLRETGAVSQVHEEFTTPHETHNEEDLLVGLEDVVHTNQEWVISLQQDIFFKLGAFDLVVLQDNIFPK